MKIFLKIKYHWQQLKVQERTWDGSQALCYCQLIKENSKAKRLEWHQKCLNEVEQFSDVIWTHEYSVQLDPYRTIISRRKRTAKSLKPRPKHPQKIHIWGVSL